METKAYIKALMAVSFSFPLDEIERLMEKELQKEPEEMDGELVDLCIDILVKGYAEQEQKQKQEQEQEQDCTKKKHTGTKGRRVLFVVALIVLIIAVAVPVSAAFSHNKVSDKIVQFYSDHFHIDLRKGDAIANHYSDENTDLIQELQKLGFSDVILPSDLLTYDYSKDIFIQDGDCFTLATIDMEDAESKINGSITITQYDESVSSTAGEGLVFSEFKHIEQVNINGLDVIIFGNDDETSIRYLDNNTDYIITLRNCDVYTAVEIANSLK